MLNRILPHLFMITPENPVPEILYANCSVYVVFDEQTLLLIDSGNGFSHRSILRDLDSAGLPGKRDVTILLTHCHVDHSCGTAYLPAHFRVAAAALTAEIFQSQRYRVWYEAPELVPACHVDEVLQPGTRQFGNLTVNIVATPGHTDDSLSYVMFIDGCRSIFSGDLIMPSGIIGFSGAVDYSREKTITSLEFLAANEFDYLLTGHGFTYSDGNATVQETLERLKRVSETSVSKSPQ